MKKLLAIGLAAIGIVLGGCTAGTIETGNVGVKTRWGQVSLEEEKPGFYFYLFASMDEFTTKEVAININDMTPKAHDNLFLKDLDATVYYTTNGDRVADFLIEKKGQSGFDGVGYPGSVLIHNLARGAFYDQVSKFDSLTMHTNRSAIEQGVMKALQAELDEDPKVKGTFKITRIVIRALTTDPSIEQSIRTAVQRDKELEAMTKQVEVTKKEAQVAIEAAKGKAAANEMLNRTLTPAYLQHEYNQALMKCAEKGSGCTILVGAGNALPLLQVK
jgi:regulator of protease activity HflC (stomatin/prohibitin superfamily)